MSKQRGALGGFLVFAVFMLVLISLVTYAVVKHAKRLPAEYPEVAR